MKRPLEHDGDSELPPKRNIPTLPPQATSSIAPQTLGGNGSWPRTWKQKVDLYYATKEALSEKEAVGMKCDQGLLQMSKYEERGFAAKGTHPKELTDFFNTSRANGTMGDINQLSYDARQAYDELCVRSRDEHRKDMAAFKWEISHDSAFNAWCQVRTDLRAADAKNEDLHGQIGRLRSEFEAGRGVESGSRAVEQGRYSALEAELQAEKEANVQVRDELQAAKAEVRTEREAHIRLGVDLQAVKMELRTERDGHVHVQADLKVTKSELAVGKAKWDNMKLLFGDITSAFSRRGYYDSVIKPEPGKNA
ncbi:uncharacterized protein KY384_004045 [Bacidia gigantensis]|uniref:uncharacterized protein n=1 Tax=Bacidia gigantensis TaxID=2732470 RepID=UPI001D04F0B1|nr:uncharacterized protein KY384_004045 [Bacidia gigantensis]KAG8530690.1 hypothetical protein KY384_004045 [Bacidia gigantensis]